MSETKWDPIQYNKVADFVAKLGEPLLELLAPKPTDVILDLGCGDGNLTQKIKPLCKEVMGVDASAEMVSSAVQKGLDAYVKDAQELDFHESFDSVFSNAALHWMTTPEKVVKGVFQALKPKGIFVAEFGGYGNAGKVVDALSKRLTQEDIEHENPWYFPTAETYAALLIKQGFAVEYIELFDRFTPLPEHLSDWIEAFGQVFFKHASEAQKRHIINDVTAALKPTLFVNGQWHVDYVRLRLKASKS
ncbi:MAG: trans-aconitate methyltransferase [Alphaproteobacteria bacterium]|jgi:trans-aconitate methyltransferase